MSAWVDVLVMVAIGHRNAHGGQGVNRSRATRTSESSGWFGKVGLGNVETGGKRRKVETSKRRKIETEAAVNQYRDREGAMVEKQLCLGARLCWSMSIPAVLG